MAPDQRGRAVLIQDEESLRLLYFCIHAGVQKWHRDGLSTAPLEPLKALIRRAIMSVNGHEQPVYVLAERDSSSQDIELWNVSEAAAELELGVRQVRRLAKQGLGIQSGREWMLPKARVLALKQEREWKARNGSRHLPRAA
jgi:hypothetical protein